MNRLSILGLLLGFMIILFAGQGCNRGVINKRTAFHGDHSVTLRQKHAPRVRLSKKPAAYNRAYNRRVKTPGR